MTKIEEDTSMENDNVTHTMNNVDDHSAMLDYEDDGNSTIYHVPSFLLKTYEIVDVSFRSSKSFFKET